MSLFEDNRYLYRDTFFVFFSKAKRPSRPEIETMLNKIGSRYRSINMREIDGSFESITIFSPQDHSAMDIVCVEGDDVGEQIHEIMGEFKTMTLTKEDRQRLSELKAMDCRMDIFHFGEVSETDEEDDDFLDPGGLMAVLEQLAELTNGISYDPQSQSFL
jgi:hypothetical protein